MNAPESAPPKPQCVGREWDPVASYTKLGLTITLTGKEIDTTSTLLTQTLRVELDVVGVAHSPSGDKGVVYDEFKEQLWRSE